MSISNTDTTLIEQARALVSGEPNPIANAANLSALLMQGLPDLNWCGFYFFDGNELVLGPFQGKPACLRIPLNRGVCGHAATTREIQVVDDVHQFAGHIACDAASRAELVVPLIREGELIGVLDLDSPRQSRFNADDAAIVAAVAAIFVGSLGTERPVPFYVLKP